MKYRLGKTGFVYLLLIVTCLAIYFPGLQGPFVFDDLPGIVENPAVAGARTPWEAITRTGPSDTAGYGRPLVTGLWWLQYQLGHGSATVFHVVSLSLHLLNSLLVLCLLKKMLAKQDEPLAILVSLLWAWHPLLGEAVLYASQQTELLVSLMILGTLNAALSRRWMVAVICCAIGMFCKELMVVTPLLVWLALSVGKEQPLCQTFKKNKAFHLALWGSCLIVIALMSAYPRTQSTGNIHGWNNWNYLLTQSQVLSHYLLQAVWPSRLAIDLYFPRIESISQTRFYGGLIVSLLAMTVYLLIQRQRTGFWAAWFFVILAPTSSFIPITTEIAAQRRMYLPLLGIGVVLVGVFSWGLRRIKRAQWLLPLGIIICGTLALTTYVRSSVYQSEISLYQDTVSKFPGNRRAVRNLGSWYFVHQRYEDALQAYDNLLRRWPDSPLVQYDRATTLIKLGRIHEAQKHFESLVKKNPNEPIYLHKLGMIHAQQGRYALAQKTLARALLLSPHKQAIQTALAKVYDAQGKIQKALQLQKQALKIPNPQGKPQLTGSSEDWNFLGLLYVKTQQWEQAKDAFQNALRARSDDDPTALQDAQANLRRVNKILASQQLGVPR